MDGDEYVMRFKGLSAAKAHEQATRLLEALRTAAPGVQADLEKASNETMGTTVVLVHDFLATAAIAKGIANFMACERPGKLQIKKDGKVIFSGDSGDATCIAIAFARSRR